MYEEGAIDYLDEEDTTELVIQTIIKKKNRGEELTNDDIKFFINSVVHENIRQAQTGAMLMSIFINGMTTAETVELTKSFIYSGDYFRWPQEWSNTVVDKHSTGGVGDKISLPLVPVLLACGLKVPMIAGRGLGFTGGTLDKLEAIPGFNVNQEAGRVRELVTNLGGCIVGQTRRLNPADRIIYTTRSVTSTVESMPLIVASIISKKALEGISCLILDVKFGKAAFMKTIEDGRALAKYLVSVSNGLGIKTAAMLTSMECPIGKHIGNALEVKESVECLQGLGPSDLEELVVAQAGILLQMTGKVNSRQDGEQKALETLQNGTALKFFNKMLKAQGVSKEDADKLCMPGADVFDVLKKSNRITEIKCLRSGYIHHIEALPLAEISFDLGAGRRRSFEDVNPSVGIELTVTIGEKIFEDDVWAKVHHNEPCLPEHLISKINNALIIAKEPIQRKSRIHEIITE